ncbi:hypothetical protein PoB_007354900 [Plakobranchus ocellatus]|uniref:Uncharacterized protein n=1 Tax=Plakobranchus ocellatus TaxID=259542 RepID=A0AAV4DS92_9GAST|nr:hypothetical protein PoB_007354900 [Plakobranchus ocellatus]
MTVVTNLRRARRSRKDGRSPCAYPERRYRQQDAGHTMRRCCGEQLVEEGQLTGERRCLVIRIDNTALLAEKAVVNLRTPYLCGQVKPYRRGYKKQTNVLRFHKRYLFANLNRKEYGQSYLSGVEETVTCIATQYSLVLDSDSQLESILGLKYYNISNNKHFCKLWFLKRASPEQGGLRLSCHPSGQSASDGARTRDRRVPEDFRVDSLSTVPTTPPDEEEEENQGNKNNT